jgi:catechol 2,3-dioxygenase-like lactoylglutathione lyase family enzyme
MHLTPHHVGLIVSDIERSIAFYEALGFSVETRHDMDDKTIVFLEQDGFALELFDYAQSPEPPLSGPRRIGFRHLALRSADIEGDLVALAAAGYAPADVQVRTVLGAYRIAFVYDPDGTEIELQQEL